MPLFSKANIVEKTVEITKEYARSGGNIPLDVVLKDVYEELKRINSENDFE